MSEAKSSQRNLLGTPLTMCSQKPLTGFFRTGCCETGPEDRGLHVVCTRVTQEFLLFSRSVGNDLSTPQPGFAGLKPGDQWCLCAVRWKQAFEAGVAPPVILAATNEKVLEVVPKHALLAHAIDGHVLN